MKRTYLVIGQLLIGFEPGMSKPILGTWVATTDRLWKASKLLNQLGEFDWPNGPSLIIDATALTDANS